ncbi:hypothetical protein YC2023_011295 [Brassica napus]
MFYFGYDPIGRQFKMLCKTTSNTHHVLTLETGKRLWRRIESKFSSEENFGIHGDWLPKTLPVIQMTKNK